MLRRLSLGLLAAMIVALVASGFGRKLEAQARPIQIAFLYSDGNLQSTLKAWKQIVSERPDLKSRVRFTFLTESVFDDMKPADIGTADVLVFDIMNQQLLDRFNAKHSVDLITLVRRRGRVVTVGEGLLPKETYTRQGVVWDERARAFWQHSGFANQVGLLKFALAQSGVSGLQIPTPQRSLDFGYYYPDGRNGLVFATWNEFAAWKQANGKLRPGAPRIAVGFYKSSYYGGETELLDALIKEIERRGAEAIPVFGYPGEIASERLLLDEGGKPRADAQLAFYFNFSGPDAAKSLAKVDIANLHLISLYGRTEQEWRASAQGLSMFEGTFQVAVPELAGTVSPTVVGSQERVRDAETGLSIVVRRPIASRVVMTVSRALKYAALKSKANADKKLAIVFYNYPAGKANIGASYLNVAESLANVLQRLKAEGYNVGAGDLSGAAVLAEITEKARNVGGYAPGELQELVAKGSAVNIPSAEYSRWLDGYAPSFKAKVLKDWGAPEKQKLMMVNGPRGPSFVVPVAQFGNIALLPQPARGWGEDTEKMYHAKDLAPPHQYVAAYAWLRHGFKADAVVHVGTHGTLEWLDGKDIGLSEEDASDALMADLPDIYIYNVDVVGEGLVARRRGAATLVDHMVPPFKKGGLYAELAALNESVTDFQNNLNKNPELAKILAERTRKQIVDLGLAKDLGVDLSTPDKLTEDVLHEIEEHLLALKEQNIPYGLHTFGRTPDKMMRESTVEAIVSVDRKLLPNPAKVFAADMEQRIVSSGTRELDNLVRALRGGYVTTGGGGEPVRNPDAYPTGKNFYGIDPDKVPKPASWELGVKLADQMLADHLKKNGKYPEKVSFVIWGDETMRHEGVIESQIFHLLGTKPVWNDRGKVVGVDVVPSAQLKRPRVDIVIASAAEGMFNNVTVLMDQAVQKVKSLEETENYVRKHYLATKATLIQRGYSEADADKRAGVRIFDEAPGQFNLNTSTIASASGTWDSDKGMADDYLRKLGHAYGNGFWGESMEDVFRLALSGTEKIVHSSSTTLYGALDNDDMFMYMGGLATAIRNIDGKATGPEMVVTNTRDPGKPEMTSIDKFIGTEFRSRYVNPAWIEGMKKEGYAGAGEMRQFVEYLWGWDATATEVVDDKMWQETFGVYVEDKHKLGMADFFDKSSPFAYQDMTARMIETVRKGYWKADAATEKKLLTEYLESVSQHGVSCVDFTCGNPRLQKYVMEKATAAGVPVPLIENFQQAMEQVTGQRIEQAAQDAANQAASNEARIQARLERVPAASRMARQLEGLVMEAREQNTQTRPRNAATVGDVQALWAALPVLAILVAWRWRRKPE